MVDFVGAGPGAEDLITVRGMELIKNADVIIYAGSLVNPGLLKFASDKAKVYDSAYMTLEQVCEKMKDAHSKGLSVVRLHPGDASLYGAIREQMDFLDKENIPYRTCPGVSACFGAAASMNLEYTLPTVSQTLIITRAEGRTAVPEKESLELLASHKASMAVYLSVGILDKVERDLLAGGLDPDTPVAIVYKATWPEEKVIYTTLENLADVGRENEISKTAVVLVGEAIRPKKYERSKLYDPDFETGYRKHTHAKKAAICFSEDGKKLLKRMNEAFEASGMEKAELYICPGEKNISTGSEDADTFIIESRGPAAWAKDRFDEGAALIFASAAGIALRAVAGCVKDKLTDSPVVVMDDMGEHVIPLLSGHANGANKLACTIAGLIGAEAVLTTATDVHGAFSADVFARENNLKIVNRDGIKKVSAKALEGKSITLSVKDYPPAQPVDIIIADETDREYSLLLKPKRYTLGIGMKKDTPVQAAEDFINDILEKYGIKQDDIYALCTIDIKEEEPAIRAYCNKHSIPLITFDASMLQKAEGEFEASEFVKEKTGVDNVCERAAILGGGMGSKLIVKKQKGQGITLAVAERNIYYFGH